ncbi:MAG TPA: hypothetical protein VND23_04070, partial [Acidimicrobiales bacterium]|nr:hypothetical protein [Acidimicrobiales bacterium]
VTLGVPTRYLAHAKPDAILARLGLDAAGIAASTLAEIERVARTPARDVSRRPAATAEGRPGGASASLPAGRGRVAR